MIVTEQDRRRAIHQDFGRTTEVVVVKCSVCFKSKKARCDHRASDVAIARRHFPRWTIKGVYGAKRTRCPQCFRK
jgi:hypothetical protein